jgi:hypothetical protein
VQLAEILYPDGEGGHHPATSGDVILDTTARSSATLTEPDHVEAVFLVLAGEARVSLDDWEIDEQLAPDTRAMPVTLFGSTFSRRDAIGAVARAFDVTPNRAVALTSEFLERESVVRVLPDPEAISLTDAEHVRTRSGRLIPATSGDRRYTTAELLAAEERIVTSAVERIEERTAQVAPALVEQVLERHPHLDGEQADGVRALLTSGNGYDWSSDRPGRASRPCSLLSGSAGRRRASGSSGPRWQPGRRPIWRPAPASPARHSPRSSRSQGIRWADPPARDRGRRGLHGREPLPRQAQKPPPPGDKIPG